MTNVTAKYSGGAVHLGGGEMIDGRWSPACGVMTHSGGGRTPKPLYPTDKAVTCKRCLKKAAAAQAITSAPEALRKQVKAAPKHIGRKPSPLGLRLGNEYGLKF